MNIFSKFMKEKNLIILNIFYEIIFKKLLDNYIDN